MNTFKMTYKLVQDGQVTEYMALVAPHVTLADFLQQTLPGRQSVIITAFDAVSSIPPIPVVDNDDDFDWNR